MEKEVKNSEVYTLKVYPQGMGREVYRTICISQEKTLDALCSIILESFDFIDEHLYEFCMDNRMYSDDSYQSDPEYRDQRSTKTKLKMLHLEKGQKFTLHYDFGDDWMFIILVQKIESAENNTQTKILKSKGEIEQYPDWDDEDFED